MFVLRDGVWTDAARVDSGRTVKIKPFSEAYFKLIDAIPELRDVFALGDKVIVATRLMTVEVTDAGLATISDADLRAIQSSW